jgi:hypothetical protein
MSIDARINALVVQEFRLHSADTAADAAGIVAEFSRGVGPAVPLLTSIDDSRDVATVRALRPGDLLEGDPAERVALEPLVASWQPPRQYGPRITERSESPPSYYRLAVTESGINNASSDALASRRRDAVDAGEAAHLGLLWIGLPLGTYAGLMVLVGDHDDPAGAVSAPREWPLPFSRALGVRIYESQSQRGPSAAT